MKEGDMWYLRSSKYINASSKAIRRSVIYSSEADELIIKVISIFAVATKQIIVQY